MEQPNSQEQVDVSKKQELLAKFYILSRTYPVARVPDFTEDSDLALMEREYDRMIRQLALEDALKETLVGYKSVPKPTCDELVQKYREMFSFYEQEEFPLIGATLQAMNKLGDVALLNHNNSTLRTLLQRTRNNMQNYLCCYDLVKLSRSSHLKIGGVACGKFKLFLLPGAIAHSATLYGSIPNQELGEIYFPLKTVPIVQGEDGILEFSFHKGPTPLPFEVSCSVQINIDKESSYVTEQNRHCLLRETIIVERLIMNYWCKEITKLHPAFDWPLNIAAE